MSTLSTLYLAEATLSRMRTSAKILAFAILLLSVIAVVIWYAAIRETPTNTLQVHVFKDGSSLIETPSGRRILIDGGADDSVLRELGAALPFYDRSIDLLISTAQTPEEAAGLTSVLDRYVVHVVARSAAVSNAPQLQAFTGALSRAQQSGTRLVIAQRGQAFDLGGGTYLQLFFPDRDASHMPAGDGCLMFKVLFGKTSFFFACGPGAIEQYVAMLDGNRLHSDVLIATGDEPEAFLGLVSAQFVVTCGQGASSSTEFATAMSCSTEPVFTSDGQTVRER